MAAILCATVVASLVALVFALHLLRVRTSQARRDAEAEKPEHTDVPAPLSKTVLRLRARLQDALPGSVICAEYRSAFEESSNNYWAQQACEVLPACVVRPRNTQEVATAVKILRKEFDDWMDEPRAGHANRHGLFAIRGGGHSPVAGAATVSGGILLSLSLFNEVTPSLDGKSVVIGARCRWRGVYQILEERGLAVIGGRNSAVGVGGLTLGGGLSFSPLFGFVCSNIIEYQVVLADGSVVTASETDHPNLWRALKGGLNNFGIVTSLTARTFPSAKVWSGFLYMLPSQGPKVLSSFDEFLDRAMSDDEGKTYDQYAARPIACFTYLSKTGIQAIAVNLVHTALPKSNLKWPQCWQRSQFASLWRLWSTCKVRSLRSATDELHALNPPSRRQTWGTTTIKNDPATLTAAYEAYCDGVDTIRKFKIKDVSWILVLQPLLPDLARKGQPNPLGVDNCPDEPLVIVQFTVNWASTTYDDKIEAITRTAIEQIDTFANKHSTGHRYRYLNYCGNENVNFLRKVSRQYDPDGLFQRGCAGGFKLRL
ncbi:FAD-binding domain-containing protein [Lizonia empirigonia]|nr:FAD-binding domain-containing protein [Lizonia empirigonia]